MLLRRYHKTEVKEKIDYDSYTKSGLKTLLDEKGVEYTDRDNKDKLIKLLERD